MFANWIIMGDGFTGASFPDKVNPIRKEWELPKFG